MYLFIYNIRRKILMESWKKVILIFTIVIIFNKKLQKITNKKFQKNISF